MPLYTKDSIERLKEAVDMVELVGARTDLRRVGSRWVGLCPFHDERTPSFSVNAEHKLYHCFGCGESGDAISFVEAQEALDFVGAVELLADRYNVELQRESQDPEAEERQRRRDRLLQLLERTTRYYERYLWESSEAARAREYLESRKLSEEVLRTFRVGFAPSAWDRVLVGAQQDGFSVDELLQVGLVQAGREGRPYDRFRGRIVFPLADERGKVRGFGARALGENQRPKYLNTAENSLYHKREQLYGLHLARAAAARRGRVIAVEGYTDVLALHQSGITETVAVMGTSLTDEQIQLLRRAAGDGGSILLALDADRAGEQAMLRSAKAAEGMGVKLQMVDLPPGTDPADSVLAEGAATFESRLEGARLVPDFEARRIMAAADLSTAGGRDRALASVRPLVQAMPPQTKARDQLVEFVAERLEVPHEYVEQGGTPPATAPGRPRPEPMLQPTALVDKKEKHFLAKCLARGSTGRSYLERLTDAHLALESHRRLRRYLVDHFEDPLAALPEDDAAFATLIKEVAMRDEEEAPDDVLTMDFLQLDLRRVQREIQQAQREGDLDRQRRLAPEQVRIKNEINELMGQAV
jgi:DNA primase